MGRNRWIMAVVAATGLLTGCVERHYIITSNPPGARVLRNGEDIGATPVDDYFVYYGKYHFTLEKDGYQTLHVNQEIATPWYEYFPMEIISENFITWHIEDVRRFHYDLIPLEQPNADALLREAQNVRNRGRSLRPPTPSTAPAAAPSPAATTPPRPG